MAEAEKKVSLIELNTGDWIATEADELIDTDGDENKVSEMDLLKVGKFMVDIFVPVGAISIIAPGLSQAEATKSIETLQAAGELVHDLRGTL